MLNRFGKHFVVYGPTGAGKSTLAQQIAWRTSLPFIELDSIFWLPDWKKKPLDQFRSDVVDTLSKCPDGWVCDGNYSNVRDIILPRADTVVWLRTSFPVSFWRLWKRTISRCRDGKLLWGKNKETWRVNFLSRESLLLYQITHWHKYNRLVKQLDEIPHRAPVIQLRTRKEVDAFLEELGKYHGMD